MKVDANYYEMVYEFCCKYKISTFFINPTNNTVDVDEDVCLESISTIPFKFGHINGDFDCGLSNLDTLVNCPISVKKSFYCSGTLIKTLKDCPKYVGGNFYCSGLYVDAFEYRWLLFSTIDGTIHTSDTRLDEILNKYKNIRSKLPVALSLLRQL